MESQRMVKLIKILEDFRNTVDEKVAKKLELDKCKRIIERLSSFSTDCEECDRRFFELEDQIIALYNKKNAIAGNDFKQHKQIISNISSHLQKQHKLVPSGYYQSLYMTMGISLGVVFGLLLFDNIGLGIPLGLATGVAIGAGLDADAKKKGLTI